MESNKTTQTTEIGQPQDNARRPKVAKEPQSTKAETTTGIARLDAMLRRGSWSELGAMYGCLKLARCDRQLGEKLLAVLKSQLRPFLDDKERGDYWRGSDGSTLDVECEVLPVVEWLALSDGFQASGAETSMVETPSPEKDEAGDPIVRTVKRWMSNRPYSEKLTAVLLWELINKESQFAKPDHEIGNGLSRQWRDEIIKAAGDPAYLRQAPVDEAAVTSTTAMMIPWQV